MVGTNHISQRKLIRMAVLSFENGLRLHFDAIRLFDEESFPSAYLLSVLSLEELGKSLALEDYLWHSATSGRYPINVEREFLSELYDHRYKQRRFVGHLDLPDRCRSAIQKIVEGLSEYEKQAATYVGLKRVKGKVNFDGRLINPLRFSRKKALDQVTVVNDFVVTLALGCLKGTHSMDLVGIEALFTADLIRSLRKKWPKMQRSAAARVSRLEKYDDLSLEERDIA